MMAKVNHLLLQVVLTSGIFACDVRDAIQAYD